MTVPIGEGSKVSLYTKGGAHLVADVAGYFQPAETGRPPLPADDVASVVCNVTAVNSLGSGYVTAWSARLIRPNSSNRNSERAGPVIANLVTTPVGALGAINLYTRSGGHLIADVAGYYTQ